MNKYVFLGVSYNSIKCLRGNQISDLKGQIHDPLEEHIEISNPQCIQIKYMHEEVGYALLDDKDERGVVILEFYIVLNHRKKAKQILNKLIFDYSCNLWFVNSQDSFAMPLMLENSFKYELYSFIFSMDCAHNLRNETNEIVVAKQNELQSVFSLVMQDGFFTGDGQEALEYRISKGEIYLLCLRGKLIGVGFVSPLKRTPQYADIAMIIDKEYRQKGYAFLLVSQLVRISNTKGFIPTALTSSNNIASRKTLEKCGFFIDGCMILAHLEK